MTPDAKKQQRRDKVYLVILCDQIGLRQQDIAARLGIGTRTLQGYLGSSGPKCPYPVQFCLEVLAKDGK